MQNKVDLRKQVMTRVRQMTPAEREQASHLIAEQVFALPAYQDSRVIMAFSSMPTEPDTQPIILHAAQAGKSVLLPRCLKAPQMEALPWRGNDSLQPGPWGILEPVPDEKYPEDNNPDEDTSSHEIPSPDLILVPCVAATKSGLRLGHGAGYYDWFLRGQKATTICLCFQAQLLDDLPAEPHDIRMDQVIWA